MNPRISLLLFVMGLMFWPLRDVAAQMDGDTSAARAEQAEHAIALQEYEVAREILAKTKDSDHPAIARARARLAIDEGECDLAASILVRPELAKDEIGSILGDIARGCARVTAANIIERDEANGIEIRYQDEHDRELTPLIVETVVKAREALTRDLDATWPKVTRIVVVRDLLSLSAMTGLPYDAAKTTGTVAVAKWGRTTLTSPRAPRHGYGWRDTLAHELTHRAVSRKSGDRAPLWLQEGLAKREEVRWREPFFLDDVPPVDAVVEKGMERKLDRPLDQLGPSIAMLPSADAAMVAFAEVTSLIRYIAESRPPGTLGKILDAIRVAPSVDDALRQTTSLDLKGWDAEWRAALAKKPKLPLSPLYGLGPPSAKPSGMNELRERVRLAELLMGRDHPAEALLELSKIPEKAGEGDPALAYVHARAFEAAGKSEEAFRRVSDLKSVIGAYGPFFAIRGRLGSADGTQSRLDFAAAVAHDPFGPEAACESLTLSTKESPLCRSAREFGSSDLGKD